MSNNGQVGTKESSYVNAGDVAEEPIDYQNQKVSIPLFVLMRFVALEQAAIEAIHWSETCIDLGALEEEKRILFSSAISELQSAINISKLS